ncbi:hypothetical protein C4901_09120 [Acidiferrobacter sp. SPIII_3]|uniref:metallophosphoesterase n=1 Tax=Acidiferrobacter sp. SPIII_3 TaxID=1281578 RepID=UPI000D733A21|nr:metallophosphoesterase [Acidiferrobacter sp. SPIII_3]AWP23472.1 hypothetical protein C4901_09120 [Acidiferrobacter sp. SPIII_3]
MKIHLVSDVHLASWRQRPPPHRGGYSPPFDAWPKEADVTVFAGDIGPGVQGLQWAGGQARRWNRPILYVPGNHEFYGHDLPTLRAALREQAKAEARVTLLDDAVVILGGVRFIGSTLWTDYLNGGADRAAHMAAAAVGLSDHIRIRMAGRAFTPDDALKLHEASRQFIEAELSKSFDGPTVVVTHHCPSPRCHHPSFENNVLAAAFCSDLEEVIHRYQPAAWICGHTHAAVDFQVGRTRVVNNPVGYPGETIPGIPANIIEV